MQMLKLRSFIGALFLGTLSGLSACTTTTVMPSGSDSTPPVVTLGSHATLPEGTAGASGSWIPLNAAGVGGSNPSFIAQTEDHESGINTLTLKANVRVWCIDDATLIRPNRRLIEFPLQTEYDFRANPSKPQSSIAVLEVPIGQVRASCIGTATAVLEDFQIDVQATAVNGDGLTGRSGELGVVHGPIELAVTVHNICSWCRDNADRLLNGRPLLTAAELDKIKDDAAKYWGSKDIVLLNETVNRTEFDDIVARMRAAGRGPVYVEHFEQTAIVSRWPLLARRTSKEDGWWTYPDGNRFYQPSYALRAVAMVRDRPFDVYSVYWQHQPASADWGNPQPSASSRVASARWMKDNWQEYRAGGGGRIGGHVPRLIGGDFNSARMRQSTASLSNVELGEMLSENSSAFDQVRVLDQNFRPGEPMIDHLFVSGPWKADVYTDMPDRRDATQVGAHYSLVSDHPVQDYVFWRVKD